MAEVIRMPRMSDTMTEGTFVEWHKKVGDTVKSGDILAEVETDKATMELENYVKGTLLYIGVEKGKSAQVDQVIAIVGAPGEDFQALLNDSGKTAAPVEKKEEKAPEAEPKAEAKTEVKQETKVETKTEAPVTKENTEDGRIKASPLAKKIAQDKGISLDAVSGSGPEGRIIKKDVEEFVPQTKEAAKTEKPVIQIPQIVGEEGYDETPVSQMRKVIAARLSQSKFTAPHFYLTMSINMDNAMTARVAMNEVSPVKISFNDMIIKASAMALRKHPDVNSSWMGDFIRQNHHVHIGSALALPEGLIVPVIRFADQKTLSQIAADAKELYGKAKDKRNIYKMPQLQTIKKCKLQGKRNNCKGNMFLWHSIN